MSIWNRFIFVLIHILRTILLLRTEIHGRENIPADGRFIVVTNHASMMDPPLMFLCFPENRWKLFAAESWERVPVWGWLLKKTGAIFIQRGLIDRKALKEGLDAVEAGYTFGVAPEGTRSKSGQLQRGRDGAAYLASRTSVPILPVSMVNTSIWQGNFKRGRKTILKAYIGPAFVLPDLGRRPKSRDLSAYTHLIMAHIANGLPTSYHGYYADSPAVAALRNGEDPWPFCLEAEGIEL